MSTTCDINKTHCENCGSAHPEDVDPWANDGYSACCNELIVLGPSDCRNHHGDH